MLLVLSSRTRRPRARHAISHEVEVEDEMEGTRERAMDWGGQDQADRPVYG